MSSGAKRLFEDKPKGKKKVVSRFEGVLKRLKISKMIEDQKQRNMTFITKLNPDFKFYDYAFQTITKQSLKNDQNYPNSIQSDLETYFQ
jgi:hypothetical protein